MHYTLCLDTFHLKKEHQSLREAIWTTKLQWWTRHQKTYFPAVTFPCQKMVTIKSSVFLVRACSNVDYVKALGLVRTWTEMCVCVCVCVWVCLSVCWRGGRVNGWEPESCICVSVCLCVCACICVFEHESVYASMCVCACACMHVCVCAWMCVCTVMGVGDVIGSQPNGASLLLTEALCQPVRSFPSHSAVHCKVHWSLWTRCTQTQKEKLWSEKQCVQQWT